MEFVDDLGSSANEIIKNAIKESTRVSTESEQKSSIGEKYLKYMKKRYPNLSLLHDGPTTPWVIKDGESVAGIVMPLREQP
jgi:hypothetical protein